MLFILDTARNSRNFVVLAKSQKVVIEILRDERLAHLSHEAFEVVRGDVWRDAPQESKVALTHVHFELSNF